MVNLTVGSQSVVGRAGDQVVTWIRRGGEVFGTFRGKPVRMNVAGNDEQGYRLVGTVDKAFVDWRLHRDWIVDDLRECSHEPLDE